MENEEKILHMLQAIQEQMKAMQEQIAQLEKADEETEQRIEQVIADTEKSFDSMTHDMFGIVEVEKIMRERLDKHYEQLQQLADIDGKLIKRIERLESDVRLAKGAAANAMVNSWKL